MTEEELEKEAIFYAENIIPADMNYYLTKKYSKEQIQQAYLAGAEPREKRIAVLEKENAELREKLLREREIYWSKGFECSRKKQSEKLAEAKDLLRVFLEAKSIEETCIAESKAEKFLKEC